MVSAPGPMIDVPTTAPIHQSLDADVTSGNDISRLTRRPERVILPHARFRDQSIAARLFIHQQKPAFRMVGYLRPLGALPGTT